MSKSADSLVVGTPREDGALQNGDVVTGDGRAVPSREPISRPPTLGGGLQPAPIVGDQVSGMPDVADNSETPDLPTIERVKDSRTTLPCREVEP